MARHTKDVRRTLAEHAAHERDGSLAPVRGIRENPYAPRQRYHWWPFQSRHTPRRVGILPDAISYLTLGVDLTTVTRAYTEARNRGLISSFSGRGSFVAGVGEAGDEMRIDLSMNTPPQPASGNMGDALKLAIDEVLARQGIEAMSAYQDTWSGASIVQAGRAWLRPAVGAMAGQQELIVCAGTQAAIFSLLSQIRYRVTGE